MKYFYTIVALSVLHLSALAQITSQPSNATVCETTNTSFAIAINAANTSPSFQWQEFNGSVWVTLTNTAPYSGVTTKTLTLTSVSFSLTDTLFRCLLDSSSVRVDTSNSAKIIVNKKSTDPTSISATVNPVSCPSGATSLSLVGGSLGAGATWKWFTVSCGGTAAGSGTPLVVNPTTTTAYFARAEGTCNATNCVSKTITVTNTNSTAPTSISAIATTISCPGDTTSLFANGGSLGSSAKYYWFTGGCSSTLADSGITIIAKPSSTTSYFVKAVGTCNTTSCASATITVTNTSSTAPTSISAISSTLSCPSDTTTLRVSGGALGSSAKFYWYSGGCSGTLIDSGSSIIAKPSATTIYFAKAKGTCNTTSCVSTTITVTNTNSTSPTSISAISSTLSCPSDTTTLFVTGGSLGSGAAWEWFSGSCGGTSAGSGTSILVNPSSTITYLVRAKGTCNSTSCASKTIAVTNTNSTAPAGINASVNPVCLNQNCTLSVSGGGLGSGASWKWYTSGCGATPAGTGTSLVVSPASATNYSVRAEGTCNTTTCASFALSVNTPPVITSNPISSAICETNNTTFNVAAVGTNLTYQWQVNTGASWSNISAAGANPTYANFTKDTLKVFGVVANNTGNLFRCVVSGTCSPKDTSNVVSLTVHTAPSITSQPNDATLCTGNNTAFQVSANGNALTYQWQVNTGSGWNSITAGGSNPTYANFSTNILDVNSVVVGNNGYQYRCIISGTCSPNDTSNIVNLTVNTVPSIISQPKDSTLCEGKNATFKIVATTANNTSLTYKWQVNNGSGWSPISTAGSNPVYSSWATSTLSINSVISWNNNYQYRCIVSGVCSPPDTSNAATLNVNSTPSIAAHPINSPLCEGGNTSFQITANGTNLTYQWQVNTGSGWNDITTAGGSPIYSNWDTYLLQVKSVATGNNNYQYRCVISNNGCITATSNAATLKVNAKPTVNAGNDTAFCQGSSVGLSSSASGTPPYTYSWSPSSGLNSINIYNPTASPASTTIYILVVTDSNTCSNADTVKVTVNPLPTANAGFDAAICAGDSTQIVGGGGTSYGWSPSASLSNPVNANTFASPTATTVYTLTVKDNKGCENTDNVKIAVNPLPIANAGADISICVGDKTQLGASGGVYYTWSPAVDLSNSAIVNPIAVPKNSTTYTCIVTDLNGCKSKDDLYITVNSLPKANAGADISICVGGSTVLNGSGGIGYIWNPGIGLSSASISSPTAQPNTNTNYQLTVIDSNGCVNWDTVNVTVNLLPKADAGPDVSICTGSSVQLSGKGGTIYSWSPSTGLDNANIPAPTATPASTQLYILSIDDSNGCKGKDSVTITVIPKPTPTILTTDTIVCRNSSWKEYCIIASNNSINWSVDSGGIINGQGSSCIMVHWSNVSSGIVSVSEHLWNSPYCGNSDTKTISMSNGTAPAPANVSVQGTIATRMLLCPFSNYKYYYWGYENKTKPIIEDSTCSGHSWCQYSSIDTIKYCYWVYVGDDMDCLTKSYYNEQPVAMGIASMEFDVDISLFPNPTNGQLTINSRTHIESIEVFNMLGERIYGTMLKAQQYDVDLSSYAKGIYVVRIRTNEGHLTRKVVKE